MENYNEIIKIFDPGDIILLARKGRSDSFFSKGQRFFTGGKWTHSAVIMDNIYGHPSVFSANELIVTEPLIRYFEEESEIEVYRINNVESHMVYKALSDMYLKYASKYYGFAQILWFMYRWLKTKIFGPNVTFSRNFFPKSIICSEMVHIFLQKIFYNTFFYTHILSQYDQNNVHVTDIRDILQDTKNFSLIYKR